MSRKIKQIAVSAGTDSSPDLLYAVCEDNSLWVLTVLLGKGWERLPSIPFPHEEQHPTIP